MIKCLRSSGFNRLFYVSKTSLIKSLNMGKPVTEEIRRKIIALRQANFSSHLEAAKFEKPLTPAIIWNTFVANRTVLPKSKSGRPKKLSKRDEKFLVRKVPKDRFLIATRIQQLQPGQDGLAWCNSASSCPI